MKKSKIRIVKYKGVFRIQILVSRGVFFLIVSSWETQPETFFTLEEAENSATPMEIIKYL